MAALQKADFEKQASGGSYAGKTRHEIFALKIKDDKKFIVGNTEAGRKVTGVSYEYNPRDTNQSGTLTYYIHNKKELLTVSNRKIFKDGDFGGGSAGSGGGAEVTKFTESTQCYYCAYVFKHGRKIDLKKPPTTDELKSCENLVYASKSLDDCIKKGPAAWFEDQIYAKTANAMFEKFKGKFKGTVYFHRSGDGSRSKLMDNIYQAKLICARKDRQTGEPQAPGSFSNDKWNPGDIWATTLPNEAKPLHDFTDSWGELNDAVARLSGAFGGDAKILGISLKRLSGMGKVQEFNIPGTKTFDDISFSHFTFGQTNNFFSSTDAYLYTLVQGRMQLRTFSTTSSWQGQITGAAAAGGKIGGGNLAFYLNLVTNGTVKMFGALGTEDILIRNEINNNAKYSNDFYKFYVNLAKSSKNQRQETPMTEAEFEKKLGQSTDGFRVSKYITTRFINELIKLPAKEQNEIMTLCWLYASSATDQSSYYIKIS